MSHAQKIIVIDEETKQPLQFVSVVGFPSQKSVSTNANGMANVKPLKNNNYLVFQMMGYQKLKIPIASLVKKTTTISLESPTSM